MLINIIHSLIVSHH